MKQPFFSIIIPTLNEEKYLPTILQSLTEQTFRDFELFLVDGKSDDRTQAIFKQFKKNLPVSTLVVSEKRNVSFQRNLGAKKAAGKYLIFFDADVNIGPTFLEEIHIAAVKQNFQYATTWMTTKTKNTLTNLMLLLVNLGLEFIHSMNKPLVAGFNTIVKRETFYKLHGFGEDIKIGEDHDFALRAARKNIELKILKEPLLETSLRRLQTEGKLRLLRKYTHAHLHTLLKGPITEELFDYPMGGHIHTKRTRKINNLYKLKIYSRKLKVLERKIAKLLLE